MTADSEELHRDVVQKTGNAAARSEAYSTFNHMDACMYDCLEQAPRRIRASLYDILMLRIYQLLASLFIEPIAKRSQLQA